jgi:hypothetical protein
MNVQSQQPITAAAPSDFTAPADKGNIGVALACAKAGLPIFPASCTYNEAKTKWEKEPHVKGWQKLATTDAKQLRAWWAEWPNAVPGIELKCAGLIVIDADRHGGPDGVGNLAALVAKHVALPGHPIAKTAGDGEHHYFRQWPGEKFGNSPGGLRGTGIDVRGEGGWVVAPGAMRSDGKRWMAAGLTTAYAANSIPILPDWIAAMIRQQKPKAESDKKTSIGGTTGTNRRTAWSPAEEAKVQAALNFIPSDSREIWFRIGAALHNSGWPQAREIWDHWSQTTPGAFDQDDQAKTWESFERPFNGAPVTLASLFALAQEQGYSPARGERPSQPDPDDAFTDDAIALTFADQFEICLRFVAALGKWLIWDEIRWGRDETLLARDHTRGVCRKAAQECNHPRTSKQLASAKTIGAVERLAQADRRLAATVDQWDAGPDLINTPEEGIA